MQFLISESRAEERARNESLPPTTSNSGPENQSARAGLAQPTATVTTDKDLSVNSGKGQAKVQEGQEVLRPSAEQYAKTGVQEAVSPTPVREGEGDDDNSKGN